MKTLVSWLLANMGLLVLLGFFALVIEIDVYAGMENDWSERTNLIIKTMLIVETPITIFLAAWAAKFTYQNFDEVWSRRMRWKNSNVDKLDAQMGYSIKMFFKCLLAVPGIIGIIVFIIHCFADALSKM